MNPNIISHQLIFKIICLTKHLHVKIKVKMQKTYFEVGTNVGMYEIRNKNDCSE